MTPEQAMTRKTVEFIHEGKYAAEVPIELHDSDESWSPYLSPEGARKLDTVRWPCGAEILPRQQNTDACSS